ncbi:UNVERIFIED_ORG: hypothetical protein ABRZ91_001789 [Heyndrickxia coagulans]
MAQNRFQSYIVYEGYFFKKLFSTKVGKKWLQSYIVYEGYFFKKLFSTKVGKKWLQSYIVYEGYFFKAKVIQKCFQRAINNEGYFFKMSTWTLKNLGGNKMKKEKDLIAVSELLVESINNRLKIIDQRQKTLEGMMIYLEWLMEKK